MNESRRSMCWEEEGLQREWEGATIAEFRYEYDKNVLCIYINLPKNKYSKTF